MINFSAVKLMLPPPLLLSRGAEILPVTTVKHQFLFFFLFVKEGT
jgi:hypothetical protein